MNIHYVTEGKGTPIVFFHGWGFDCHIWSPLIQPLSASYQLILVDLPGFGLTPMMEWDAFKEQLLKIMPPQCTLAGWSLGGLYAQRLALEVPGRIRSLVNITSSPRFITDSEWPATSKESFFSFCEKMVSNPEKTLNDFIQLQRVKSNISCLLGEKPSIEGLNEGLKILETWDLRQLLAECRLPACYLFGRLDPIVPVAVMEKMKQEYPQFDYILFKKSAHMPFISDKDLFIELLKRYVE